MKLIVKILLTLLFIHCCLLNTYSQTNAEFDSTSYKSQSINLTRAVISGAAITAINAAAWSFYLNTWYDRTSDKFQFRDDWYDHSLNVDKLGHFWTTSVLYKTVYKLALWSNFSETQSMWISTGLAWLQMLPIEIKDGYFVTYGFALTDLAANTLGAVYPTLQKIYPALEPFNLKMSMHLTPHYSNDKYYQIRNPVDDYEGRTFWLSIDVNTLIPKAADPYWPDWLNIAVGYGGSDMFTERGNWNIDKNRKGLGNQEWYLAFDYDLLKIFNPDENTFFYQLLDFLNMIHLPSPTIRFTPTTVVYGFYF